MKELLFYMLTSIEFLLTAVVIFLCSFLTIWWVETNIKRSKEKGFEKGFELGKIRSEVTQ